MFTLFIIGGSSSPDRPRPIDVAPIYTPHSGGTHSPFAFGHQGDTFTPNDAMERRILELQAAQAQAHSPTNPTLLAQGQPPTGNDELERRILELQRQQERQV